MILRPWHIDDIASLVKYANNINIASWTFPHPFTTANADWFIGFANGENANHYIRAIEINVEAIGSIGVYF